MPTNNVREIPNIILNPIDESTSIISNETIIKLINLGENALCLYMFYMVLSKEQISDFQRGLKVNYASNEEAIKKLKWGKGKFFKTKKMLIENNLIKSFVSRDNNGVIKKNYTGINYSLKENILSFSRSKVSKTDTLFGGLGTTAVLKNDTLQNLRKEKVTQKEKNIIKDNLINTSIVKELNIKKDNIYNNNINIYNNNGSKKNIIKMSDLEKWEMATELDVPLHIVQDTENNFFEYIEEPKNSKKYKTTYYTVRNWIKIGLSKGRYQNCNEVEKLQLPFQHPDEIAKKKRAREIAERNGWL